MTRRIRFLGALVTLVALTAYFAESVRASMCLPGMDMAVAVAESNPHAGMEHGTGGDSDAPRTDLPECPLGMAGMGSSCVAMLIPATAATTMGASEADVAGATSTADLHELLISAAQFRPPRI